MKRQSLILAALAVLIVVPLCAQEVEMATGGPIISNPPDQLSGWEWSKAVIYDNGPLVTTPGGGAGGVDISELQTGLGMGTYGFGFQSATPNRIADDFTVSDAAGWQVDTITFFGYQTGSGTTSTFTEVYVQIWNGAPNAGGAVVWGDYSTNRIASTTWANIYRVLDTAPTDTQRPVMAIVATIGTVLPPGTYWVDVSTAGSGSSGPWAPPISILGQTTTGNGLQYTSSTGVWDLAVDGGTGTQQGFPFIIDGTVLPVELQSFSVE